MMKYAYMEMVQLFRKVYVNYARVNFMAGVDYSSRVGLRVKESIFYIVKCTVTLRDVTY